MESKPTSLKRSFHVVRAGRGRKTLHAGAIAAAPPHIPWLAKWMALAIRFDQFIRDGRVRDQAELARVGHVSRARVTQIMNLTLLAPDIQEELLFLTTDSSPVHLRSMQSIAMTIEWPRQRQALARLRREPEFQGNR